MNIEERLAKLENLFSEIETRLDTQRLVSGYLTVDQASEYLSVSSRTIRRAILSGKLRAYNLTESESKKSWRIAREDLENFAKANPSHVAPAKKYTSKFLGI